MFKESGLLSNNILLASINAIGVKEIWISA